MKYINFILLFCLGLICCKKDELPGPWEYPYVITQEPSNNDSTGVTLSAKLLSTGIEEIIDYGFILIYGEKESELSIINLSEIADFKLRISTGLENKKHILTGLMFRPTNIRYYQM